MRRFWCAVVALGICAMPAAAPRDDTELFRVLSWNVSGQMPVERPAEFRGHLQLARADVVVLDEVAGTVPVPALRDAFPPAGATPGAPWRMLWGDRGGRQRVVIGARAPIEALAAFQRNAYPDADLAAILAAAPEDARAHIRADMAGGVAVNGGLLRAGGRRLLVIGTDVQCCGAPWQELRRLAEVRYIRGLVARAIETTRPDGVILAGDFNLASPPPARPGIGALPLVILSGPYPAPFHALLGAEALHRDGREAWTFNGGDHSPVPHLPLDFQLYSPHSLRQVEAQVLDTEDYPAGDLARAGLNAASSREFSDHRPVVVAYAWARRR